MQACMAPRAQQSQENEPTRINDYQAWGLRTTFLFLEKNWFLLVLFFRSSLLLRWILHYQEAIQTQSPVPSDFSTRSNVWKESSLGTSLRCINNWCYFENSGKPLSLASIDANYRLNCVTALLKVLYCVMPFYLWPVLSSLSFLLPSCLLQV